MKNMNTTKKLELKTPLGIVTVQNGKTLIPFVVADGCCNIPYEIYDGNNDTGKRLYADIDCSIVIETSDLEVGQNYEIVFSDGKLKYAASDEHTEALFITDNGWTFGLGMYNPNDFEMDDTKFHNYHIKKSENGQGYVFKLLNKISDTIVFRIACIKHNGEDSRSYEDAIGFWLT